MNRHSAPRNGYSVVVFIIVYHFSVPLSTAEMDHDPPHFGLRRWSCGLEFTWEEISGEQQAGEEKRLHREESESLKTGNGCIQGFLLEKGVCWYFRVVRPADFIVDSRILPRPWTKYLRSDIVSSISVHVGGKLRKVHWAVGFSAMGSSCLRRGTRG